jgi:glycerol-3-phosphate acyltransferase PlsY
VYAVGVWGAILAITRYMSLGSMAAMVTIPLTYFLRNGSETFHSRVGVFVFLTAAAAVVIWRHRENIRRLLRGRERKIGQPSAGRAG